MTIFYQHFRFAIIIRFSKQFNFQTYVDSLMYVSWNAQLIYIGMSIWCDSFEFTLCNNRISVFCPFDFECVVTQIELWHVIIFFWISDFIQYHYLCEIFWYCTVWNGATRFYSIKARIICTERHLNKWFIYRNHRNSVDDWKLNRLIN